MNILRGFARWLCAFGITICISTWLMVATAQATILNRNAVEGWLRQSGIYSKNLNDFLQVSSGTNSVVTSDVLSQAFSKTFTPTYIQNSTETMINATYDWLEGTQPTIHFSIPVQDKVNDFITNLSALLVPKLQQLPACTSRVTDTSTITCIPPGVTPAEYANELTHLSSDSNFLGTPLTEQTVAQQGSIPNAGWLPAAVQTAHMLFYVLPVAVLVLAGGLVLLSEDKLRGVANVGRQLTINTAITLIGGLFLWYMSSSIDLTSTVDTSNPQAAALATSYINPLARTVLPSIGQALSLYSGIVVVLGVALWVGATMWRKKRLVASGAPQHAPIPEPTDQETHLPPPTNAPTPPTPPTTPAA